MNRVEESPTGEFILAIAGMIIAFTAMAAIFVVYMSISIVLILFSGYIAGVQFLKDLPPLFQAFGHLVIGDWD
jgi:hypothetical protein